MKDRFTESSWLRDKQYADASNLEKRISLHERFSTNPQGWHAWVFSQVPQVPNAQVLELGCGPGALWAENVSRVSSDWHLTLSDFSLGMVRDARSRAGGLRNSAFVCLDATAIAFFGHQFDVVIANHMLYHVPDVDQALGQIARILKPDGTLLASTNGQGHLRELAQFVRAASGASESTNENTFRRSIKNFSLESGREMLAQHFGEVRISCYQDSLHVTDPEAIIEFVTSSSVFQLTQPGLEQLRDLLAGEIRDHGAIEISKDPGMFIARDPHGI